MSYDKPCGELVLGEDCIKIISDKSNSLGMFLRIQSDIYIYNRFKCSEPTEMLLRQKDPKGFTVQTSRSEFKTIIKIEDGQLRAKENIQLFRKRLSYTRGKAYATMSKVIMVNGCFYSCLSEPQSVSALWKETAQTSIRLFSFLVAESP